MTLASLINRRRSTPPSNSNVSEISNISISKRSKSANEAPNVSKISRISISKRPGIEIEAAQMQPECVGALIAGGPYLPWGPYLTSDRLKLMQRAVIDVVTELARIERWDDGHYDVVVRTIEQQAICTLAPDLEYFERRLMEARGE